MKDINTYFEDSNNIVKLGEKDAILCDYLCMSKMCPASMVRINDDVLYIKPSKLNSNLYIDCAILNNYIKDSKITQVEIEKEDQKAYKLGLINLDKLSRGLWFIADTIVISSYNRSPKHLCYFKQDSRYDGYIYVDDPEVMVGCNFECENLKTGEARRIADVFEDCLLAVRVVEINFRSSEMVISDLDSVIKRNKPINKLISFKFDVRQTIIKLSHRLEHITYLISKDDRAITEYSSRSFGRFAKVDDPVRTLDGYYIIKIIDKY